MNKVLLIDKPAGWTSFDVVAKIRSNIRNESGNKVKVGHAGTLDPFATGLLIVLVGSATKQQDEFMKKDKWYEVEMILGQRSTTGDPEGEIFKVSDRVPELDEIHEIIQGYIGEIYQIPPVYSAIKVGGRRAYDLARSGKEVKLEPRKVTIFDINDISYEYPCVSFNAHVSSGTYIRSLCSDIGEKLKVGAYTTSLRRTKIGGYDVKEASRLEDIDISQH